MKSFGTVKHLFQHVLTESSGMLNKFYDTIKTITDGTCQKKPESTHASRAS
jgi:hypothetical protein